MKRNIECFTRFINSISNKRKFLKYKSSYQLYSGVTNEEFQNFIKDFEFHTEERSVKKELLVKYAGKQIERGLMDDWNVVVVSRKSGELGSISINDGEIHCINRAKLGEDRMPAQLKTVSSKEDLLKDLGALDSDWTPDDYILDDYRNDRFKDEGLKTIRQIKEPSISKINSFLINRFFDDEDICQRRLNCFYNI